MDNSQRKIYVEIDVWHKLFEQSLPQDAVTPDLLKDHFSKQLQDEALGFNTALSQFLCLDISTGHVRWVSPPEHIANPFLYIMVRCE